MSKLFDEVKRPHTLQDDRVLISVRDTARMLGISIRSVLRYDKLGIITGIPVGRRKLFRRTDVLSFAQNGLPLDTLRRAKEALDARKAKAGSQQ